jgi:hypothetical protein
VWTNVDKLDIFVDNNELAQRIKNYPTRNFLVDWQTNIVEPPANWPSSTSNDNDIKQWYKNNIESKTYYYIRTLESILSVQHICQLRGISCYMFWGYPIDHEFAKTDKNVSYLYDLVDWDSFVTQQAMEEHYSQGPWFEYCTTKQHGLVPVAGWHWEFYQSHIQPIMDRHYTAHNQNKFLQLKNFVETITKEKFNQGSS